MAPTVVFAVRVASARSGDSVAVAGTRAGPEIRRWSWSDSRPPWVVTVRRPRVKRTATHTSWPVSSKSGRRSAGQVRRRSLRQPTTGQMKDSSPVRQLKEAVRSLSSGGTIPLAPTSFNLLPSRWRLVWVRDGDDLQAFDAGEVVRVAGVQGQVVGDRDRRDHRVVGSGRRLAPDPAE
jgi:hypothetical protein